MSALRYVPEQRGNLMVADLAEVGPAGVEAAAEEALRELPGWGLATSDTALAEALVNAGATVRRHAHVHSRDLFANPAPKEWATPTLPDGLRLTPWDRPLTDIAPAALAAYPPGHPDHEPRADIAEVVARDLKPYAEDGALGPRLPASGLVVDGDDRVVALVLVNDREGHPPDGGPWVTDVARMPGTTYAGTGRALLQRALADLTSTGAPGLSLAVTEGNPARRLYDSLGIVHRNTSITLKLPG